MNKIIFIFVLIGLLVGVKQTDSVDRRRWVLEVPENRPDGN
uniref:Uncharacterized protein n=1 Tax=Ciona savignyi TaxID=51511 RepID=H2Z9H8_CIOSA